MKETTKAIYVNRFLRGFDEAFSIEEFIKYLSFVDCKISKEEAQEILFSSQNVFYLEDETFLTRSAVFTNAPFSVSLSKEEIENGCFLPGHRLMPFVDPEVVSSSLTFVYKNRQLKKKIVEFSREFAYEHFMLYGEEYVSQYIANDPGMNGYDIDKNEFELPQKVNLVTIDISKLIKSHNLTTQDRLLLKVVDWDDCVISIEPLVKRKSSELEITSHDLTRKKWNKILENALIESFKKQGPGQSIESQLAKVFLENYEELCINDCGSIEEFLKHTKKVSIEPFGVETRLWQKGELVPAFGTWNNGDETYSPKFNKLIYKIPEFVLDEYLKDMAYQKKNDTEQLMSEIYPKSFDINDELKEHLLLHINTRNDIILKKYNWFLDHPIAKLRHDALTLYTKVNFLTYELDNLGGNFMNYPQQEIVILIQLYSHISKIIESIAFDYNYVAKEVNSYNLSLEGMQMNFEEIEVVLRSALAKNKKNGFRVIQ